MFCCLRSKYVEVHTCTHRFCPLDPCVMAPLMCWTVNYIKYIECIKDYTSWCGNRLFIFFSETQKLWKFILEIPKVAKIHEWMNHHLLKFHPRVLSKKFHFRGLFFNFLSSTKLCDTMKAKHINELQITKCIWKTRNSFTKLQNSQYQAFEVGGGGLQLYNTQ